MARKEIKFVPVVLAFLIGILSGVALTVYHYEAGRSRRSVAPQNTRSAAPSAASPEAFQEPAKARELKEMLRENPRDVDAWIQLGNLYFDKNRHREAIKAYEKALAIRPDNPDVLTDLGILYRRIGRPKKAVALFREANQVDPEHFQSLYNLGVVLLHDLKDVGGAIEAWEQYLEVGPQGPMTDRIRATVRELRGSKIGTSSGSDEPKP